MEKKISPEQLERYENKENEAKTKDNTKNKN